MLLASQLRASFDANRAFLLSNTYILFENHIDILMTPSMVVNLKKTVAEVSPEKLCEWLAEMWTSSGDQHLNAWSIAYSINKVLHSWLDALEATSICGDLVHMCEALTRAASAGATDIVKCLPEQVLKRNIVPSAPFETRDLSELISATGSVRRWSCDMLPAWLAPAAWPAFRFVCMMICLIFAAYTYRLELQASRKD